MCPWAHPGEYRKRGSGLFVENDSDELPVEREDFGSL